MPKANELKRGMIIEFDGVPHAVKSVDCKSPSSRGASTYYKIRYNNLQTGMKRDESHKAEEMLKTVNETLARHKKKASQHDVMVELALAAIAEMDKIDGPNTIGLDEMITFLKSKEWDSSKNLWGGGTLGVY